jgi:hypothetical protein
MAFVNPGCVVDHRCRDPKDRITQPQDAYFHIHVVAGPGCGGSDVVEDLCFVISHVYFESPIVIGRGNIIEVEVVGPLVCRLAFVDYERGVVETVGTIIE